MQKKNCCLFLNVLSIVSGLCLIFSWPSIFDCALNLRCNPMLYLAWKKNPFLLKTEIYLFNWTNPEDIYNASIKPRFEEIGPYVYYQEEEKRDIVWNDNGTVTYKQRRFWYPEENGKNLEETIVHPDLMLLGMAYVTRQWNYYLQKIMTFSTSFRTIYKTHKVSELLFEGYSEPFIKIAYKMPVFASLKLPPWERFGFFYKRNGTTDWDGVFNMGTGTNSVLGQLYQWNYDSKTEYFEGNCSKVSGSSSQFFHQNLDRSPLEIFSADLRRSVWLNFESEKEVDGILGYKYSGGHMMMDNGTINPNNKCFCVGKCMPSGLANISATRHQSPIFASMPHLYGADPYYFTLVDGFRPDKEKHDLVITIEPRTGFVLEGFGRVQINFLMQPSSSLKLLNNVTRTVVFPMFWIQQTVIVPTYLTFILKLLLILPTASLVVGLLMLVLGFSGIFYLGFRYYKPKNVKTQLGTKLEENHLLFENQVGH